LDSGVGYVELKITKCLKKLEMKLEIIILPCSMCHERYRKPTVPKILL